MRFELPLARSLAKARVTGKIKEEISQGALAKR
jgi:hypothetical protein